MPKQVKFWVYITGPVLLTLQKGQTLSHSHGGPTDEGYSWTANTWTFDGQVVTSEWAVDARDCDGRITREGTGWFACHEARAGFCAEDGTRYPNWHQGRSSQRDYSAEAMGY